MLSLDDCRVICTKNSPSDQSTRSKHVNILHFSLLPTSSKISDNLVIWIMHMHISLWRYWNLLCNPSRDNVIDVHSEKKGAQISLANGPQTMYVEVYPDYSLHICNDFHITSKSPCVKLTKSSLSLSVEIFFSSFSQSIRQSSAGFVLSAHQATRRAQKAHAWGNLSALCFSSGNED